jgi:ParB/RepB/Spo0J family partition protein
MTGYEILPAGNRGLFANGKEAQLQVLPLARLKPHPKNPRLAMCEEVIEGIAASLKAAGAFPPEHALRARPLGEDYQLVGGHQRREAALRAGLAEVPCWVKDMTDEEAYMALVLDNRHGELSPLEIGLHALEVVGRGKPGRGRKGGLSAYADQMGKTQQYLSQLVQAAEVAKSTSQLVDLHDRTQHLYAIHALPAALWTGMIEWLLSGDGRSLAETQAAVKEARDYLKTPETEGWPEYLPVRDCALACATGGLDRKQIRRLADLAGKVAEALPETLAERWRAWLDDNSGGDSWDIRKCQDKRVELEEMAFEAADAGPLATVLLADPPWRYDYSTDSRQVENQYPTATVEEIIAHAEQPWFPATAHDCVLFLWATMPQLREALAVMEGWGFEYKTGFVWDKKKIGMGFWARGRHELLLVGTRGNVSPPPPERRFPSVFEERRAAEHSRKPACVYEAIEAMFPGAVWAEAYLRGKPRPGWLGGGNEVTAGPDPAADRPDDSGTGSSRF